MLSKRKADKIRGWEKLIEKYKEGDTITSNLAETLKRLDIKPMEVGLDLVAVWEDGVIFGAKQLHVDEAEYTQKFTQAAQWAMNLAVQAAIPDQAGTQNAR